MSSKLVNMYENLKKNPDFNKKVKIEIENPFEKNTLTNKEVDRKMDNGLNEADENFIKELDRRMANKKQKQKVLKEGISLDEINKRFESIEETLKIIMEAHKKLIGKLNGKFK